MVQYLDYDVVWEECQQNIESIFMLARVVNIHDCTLCFWYQHENLEDSFVN